LDSVLGRNPELLTAAKSHLERLVKQTLREDIRAEKNAQIAEIERNERYWRGRHYWAQKTDGARVTWAPVGEYRAERGRKSVNDYVLNFYRRWGSALIGILGKVPNAVCLADVTQNEVMSVRAEKGEQILTALWSHWNPELVQPSIVGGLWRQGAQFLYTPYVVSKSRYGSTSVPRFEDQPVVVQEARYECWSCRAVVPEQLAVATGMRCPACGTRVGEAEFRPEVTEAFPIEVGQDEFANGSVELERYSGLQVSTPFSIIGVDDAPWLILDVEQHSSVLVAAHPELDEMRRKFAGPSGGDEAARQARRTATGYGVNSEKNWVLDEWGYTRAWLTRDMLAGMSTSNSSINQGLLREYPDGAKITMVNDQLIKCEGESLGSVWSACAPSVGDTLYSEPLGNCAIQMNDAINDGYNIIHQTAQKGIPINLYDPNVLSERAMKKMQATPADWLPAIPDVSGRLANAIYTANPAQLNPATMQLMDISKVSGQEIVGITPALTGTDSAQQTLGEAEIKRNQALQPHNTTWNNVRHLWRRAYENAIVQFALNSPGEVHFRKIGPLPSKSVFIEDIEELLEGGWHVEVDDSIPMTWGQRRAQVFQLLERGPEVIKMFGIDQPENLRSIHKALGNDDFDIPAMRLRDKVMADIRELLQGRPVMGPAGEFLPSVPPEEFEMDHQFWVQEFKNWANGPEARRYKGTPGYMNALARAKAEMAIVAQLNAPPMMPPPPDGGGGALPPGQASLPSDDVSPPAGGVGPAPPPPVAPGVPVLNPEDAPQDLEGI